jgi:hypothetical protein
VGRSAVRATGSMGSAAATAMADDGELGAGMWFCPDRKHRPLYRRGGLAMRAHGSEAAQGPRLRLARPVGGGHVRTRGHRGLWLATNAGAPRGGPDFEGGLGACNALGRRGAPRSARDPNGEAIAARRGISRPENISQYPCSDAKISKNLNRSAQKW